MSLEKIEPRSTLVPRVYDQLRKAILRGQLAPGTRLVENRVAADLGVSRTPVREAISRLLAQGFVKELGNGVRVVADMATEIDEIFGIRQVLEGYAARLAAANATDAELAEIEEVCQISNRAVDATAVNERAAFNNIFHSAVAKASHNDRLIKIIGEFYQYAITEEMLPFLNRDESRAHVKQHRDVAVALKRRDGDAADAAMRRHIADVLGSIKEAVTKAREGAPPGPVLDARPETDVEFLRRFASSLERNSAGGRR